MAAPPGLAGDRCKRCAKSANVNRKLLCGKELKHDASGVTLENAHTATASHVILAAFRFHSP